MVAVVLALLLAQAEPAAPEVTTPTAAESATPDATSSNEAPAAPDPPPPSEPETMPTQEADATMAAEAPGSFWDTVFGGDTSSRGDVAFDSRAFRPDDDPITVDGAASILGRVEWRHQHAPLEEKVRVFGRTDALDNRRSIVVVEEAWAQFRSGPIRLRVGADIVNWTATEAFHPADVINARNLDSEIENFEKLGEPMVAAQWGIFEGTSVQALFMPVYMKTVFPSPRSRLSFAPPGVDLNRGRRFMDRDGQFTRDDFGPQAAFRVQQVIGSADVSLHVLEHMDRTQPLVAVDLATMQPLAIFQTVRQVGLTYVHDVGAGLLLKLEAAHRWLRNPQTPTPGLLFPSLADVPGPFPDRDHAAVAVGLEYGLAHEGGGESTLLAEGQALIGPDKRTRAALSPFQRDVLIGYRYAFNDQDSREILFGFIFDVERPEFLVNLNYRQRIGETWSLLLGLRVFEAHGDGGEGALVPLDSADHFRAGLIRYF